MYFLILIYNISDNNDSIIPAFFILLHGEDTVLLLANAGLFVSESYFVSYL